MKKFLVVIMLFLSMSFTGFQSTQVEAAGCSLTPGTPYSVNSTKNAAFGNFKCTDGVYHTYRLCIRQSGTNVNCASYYGPATSYSFNVQCTKNGTAGPAPFVTSMYIYNSSGTLLYSGSGGTAYLNRCI